MIQKALPLPKMEWQEPDYPLPWNNKKTQNIWKELCQNTGFQARKDISPSKMVKKRRWDLRFHPIYCLESFQAAEQGEQTQTESSMFPEQRKRSWEPETPRQLTFPERSPRETCTRGTGCLWGAAPKYSENWLVPANKGTTQGKGEKTWKDWRTECLALQKVWNTHRRRLKKLNSWEIR